LYVICLLPIPQINFFFNKKKIGSKKQFYLLFISCLMVSRQGLLRIFCRVIAFPPTLEAARVKRSPDWPADQLIEYERTTQWEHVLRVPDQFGAAVHSVFCSLMKNLA
jgi:hypothetical protein